MEPRKSTKRRHPARRARQTVGVVSATALLGLTGFLAASSAATATTTKVTTTSGKTATQSTPQFQSGYSYDDSENWSATPAPGPSSTPPNSYVADTSSHAS